MLKNPNSHQFIISPEPDFVEEEFEKFIIDEAFQETFRASLTRVTRGITQTLSKGFTAQGKVLYLWKLNLDLMNPNAGELIFDRVLATMKHQLEPQRATVSTPFTKVVLEEDEVEI